MVVATTVAIMVVATVLIGKCSAGSHSYRVWRRTGPAHLPRFGGAFSLRLEFPFSFGAHSGAATRCPLWVKSRHLQRNTSCPLYPNSRHVRRTSRCPLSAKSGDPAYLTLQPAVRQAAGPGLG
jgi:hypothetical protein